MKLIITIAFLLPIALPAAPPPRAKVAHDVRSARPGEQVEVFVRTRTGAKDKVGKHIGNKGGQKVADFDNIRFSVYRMKAEDAAGLENSDDVETVQLNHPIQGTAATTTPDYGWVTALRGFAATGSIPYDGTGVTIAILDSGIDDADDLKDSKGHLRILLKQSVVPGDTSVNDWYGHGKHIAGIIGGSGKKSSGASADYLVRGIAPNVNLVSIRVLDRNGASTDATVIQGIDKAIQLKAQYNIRVLNLSLGRPVMSSYTDDPLCEAVRRAWEAGIVVVVAAGNGGRDNSAGTQGYGTITSPGNSPYAITVGAMNTMGTPWSADDTITSYSSKGPTAIDHIAKPDLVAPGNKIISLRDNDSALDKTYVENRVPKYVYTTENKTDTPDYYHMSGTSMAAPMVSGAAALMLQKNPALTPDQVKAALMKSATKLPLMSVPMFDPATGYQWTAQYDLFTVGAGYLDIAAALSCPPAAAGLALSPAVVFDAATSTAYVVDDERSIWGTGGWEMRSIWGTDTIWPARSIWGTAAVWGTRSIWGTSGDPAFDSIWSDRSIWATRSVWGTSGPSAMSVLIEGDR